MADMIQPRITLRLERRWWFNAAIIAAVALHHLRIVKDADRVARWIADHGTRVVAD